MPGRADTIDDPSRWGRAAAAPLPSPKAPPLRETTEFGPNPGGLRMFSRVPPGLPAGAALVVALHGCTQGAAGYDAGSGWSELGVRHGFAVLLPEQVRANNLNRCFNWFQPGDAARGAGDQGSLSGQSHSANPCASKR